MHTMVVTPLRLLWPLSAVGRTEGRDAARQQTTAAGGSDRAMLRQQQGASRHVHSSTASAPASVPVIVTTPCIGIDMWRIILISVISVCKLRLKW